MQKITKNVFLATNIRGCNTSAIVTTAGVVVIDTPMVPAEAKKWRQEVEQFGEIKYVINNEPHRDHVTGSCWMGGTLVASEGTREAIKEHTLEILEKHLKWLAPDALPLEKDFHFRLPDITFTGSLTLYLGKHSFHILEMPGHTPAMTAVYVPEERLVFTSDNIVGSTPVMFEAVPDGWMESLDKLEKLDVDIIVPGHGGVCGKAGIKVMRDNLNYFFDSVKEGINKGWSVEEIIEKTPFGERFSLNWGDAKELLHDGIAHLYEVLKK
jgi:cyclase